jgi:hypothetical protein
MQGFLRRLPVVLPVLSLASSLATLASSEGVPEFKDVTAEAGIVFDHVNGRADRKDYIFEAKGGGIGFLDYDNDGWLDIIVVQGSTLDRVGDKELRPTLFRNRGNGTFEDVTEKAGLTYSYWGMGVATADYDNDGDTDIYLTHFGPNVLYRNNGDGTFTDVTSRAGLEMPWWSTSAAFGDYDRDGDLDLYVAGYLDCSVENLPPKTPDCTYLGQPVLCGPRGLKGAPDALFRNDGDGTFTDVTESSKAVDRRRYFGLGVVWADLDGDHDPDLVVSNDATPNLVFVNQGDGTFEEMGFLSGLAVNADGMEQAGMGIDAADYDNDGKLDVFIAHFANDYSTLYRNDGDLVFRDITYEARIKQAEWHLVAWGAMMVDFNHDGWKDIIHVNGHVYPYLLEADLPEHYAQPGSLYLNQRDGTFSDVSSEGGDDFQRETVSRGAAFGDYDNDGDIDIVVANMNGSPQLFRNDRTDSHHWVIFKLVGTESNRDAIGARITVETAGLSQLREVKRTVGIYSTSDPRAHFGVGPASSLDSVEIRWPSGEVQTFKNLAVDRHYVVQEGAELIEK